MNSTRDAARYEIKGDVFWRNVSRTTLDQRGIEDRLIRPVASMAPVVLVGQGRRVHGRNVAAINHDRWMHRAAASHRRPTW